MDRDETLKIAVGLARHAAALLQSVGQTSNADRLQCAVEAVLEENPGLRGHEMTPELACLAAGIPLPGACWQPLREVSAPDELPLRGDAVGRSRIQVENR